MPSKIDQNARRTAFRKLTEFAAGAGTANLITCVLAFLLLETARRGLASTVFRYVGF
jgi:hypothetical protein